MKIYRVYNTESDQDTHEYDFVVSETEQGYEKFTLSRCKSSVWSDANRGEEVITIIDTGNGYIFPKKQFSKEVDYAEGTELFLILSIISKIERMPLYQARIEKVNDIITI